MSDFLKAEGAAGRRSPAGVRSSSPSPITLYFFRQNIIGIHESSDKALKIMIATTVMAVVILVWCGVTLWVRGGPVNRRALPARPAAQDRIPGGDQGRSASTARERRRDVGSRTTAPAKLVPEKGEGRQQGQRDRQAQDQRRHRHRQEDPAGADQPLVPRAGRRSCGGRATG